MWVKINVLHINVTSTSKKWNIFICSWSVYFLHVLDYLHVVGFSLTSCLQSMVLKVLVQFIDIPRSGVEIYIWIFLSFWTLERHAQACIRWSKHTLLRAYLSSSMQLLVCVQFTRPPNPQLWSWSNKTLKSLKNYSKLFCEKF